MKGKRASKAIVQQAGAQSYGQFLTGIILGNRERFWIIRNEKDVGQRSLIAWRPIQRAFPNLSGYSVRNLKYMRAFAAAWPDAMAFTETPYNSRLRTS
jgi:hypothetical protein